MFFPSRIVGLSLCLILLSGCQTTENPTPIETEDKLSKPPIEQGLVLYNSVLEQSNADGQTLWRLKTDKVVYTQDKKIAKLENLTGNLFENGEIILKVSADYGEIRSDGKEIYLNDNILAVDPRNQAELRGHYVEWKPEKNYFLIK